MTAERAADREFDVVVIGGGAAGLSAALALVRARRTVLVVDSGEPRNARAAHVHNFLTREGTPPAELLRIGRGEVEDYGGTVVTDTVTKVERLHDDESPYVAFELQLQSSTAVSARRLVLATGLVDQLPDIPGMADRWGRDVLHCPYCHGWEIKDQRVGVLATSPMAAHQAQMWRQWTDDVTLLVHTAPGPSAEEIRALRARGIAIRRGTVTSLDVSGDTLVGVRLDGGRTFALDALVVAPRFNARADLVHALGVEATQLEMGGADWGTYVVVDPMGATSVAGVYAAGNVADPLAQVAMAAGAGLRTGASVNMSLTDEEVVAAVRAAATSSP